MREKVGKESATSPVTSIWSFHDLPLPHKEKSERKRSESMARYFSCSISFVTFPFFLILRRLLLMILLFSSFINEEHPTDLLYSSFSPPSIHLRNTNHLTDRSTPPRVSLDGVLSNSRNKSSTHKVSSTRIRNYIHILIEVIIFSCLKLNHELPLIFWSVVPFTLL